MEINKALEKIDLSKYDLTKNSALNEIFGQLQDYTSDSNQNILNFKKFKMIITQVNAFKELTESNDNNRTILSLLSKIEALGLDNNTAKWAVKLVADRLNIKHGLTLNLIKSNTSANNISKTVSIASTSPPSNNNKKSQSNSQKPKYQQKSSSSKTTTSPTVKTSGYAATAPVYRPRKYYNDEPKYNMIAFFSAILALGALAYHFYFPQSNVSVILGLVTFIVLNVIFLGISVNNSYELTGYVLSGSIALLIYVLMLFWGLGYIFSGVLLVAVFIILVSFALLLDSPDEMGWFFLVLGVTLLNVGLIGGGVVAKDIGFYSTGILGIISFFSAGVSFGDFNEGIGTLQILLSIGNIVQFIFLFF